MANTSDTYWSVDGVSLQTFAQNIETLGETDTPPPLRGENIVIPFAPGRKFLKKTADERIIPLAMWVRGTDDDGIAPSTGAARAQLLEDNWAALRNLLFQPGRQFALTKRFKKGGVTRSATALAEYSSGLEATKHGRFLNKFVVNLKLADPYFYDDTPTNRTLTSGDQTFTLPGDVDSLAATLTINGSRQKPTLYNRTTDTLVTYNDNLVGGDKLILDVRNFSALLDSAAGPEYQVGGALIHSGAPHWLVFKAGAQTLTYTATGTGSSILSVRGAWL